MSAHNILGKAGEDAAAKYLEQNGYTIRDRNWRKNHLELDIVADKDKELIIVEVKTRTGNGYGGARRAVDARKRALIRRGAAEWRRQLPEPVPSRYDIVEVLYREGKPPEFRHIRGAFREKDLPAS